MEQSFNQSNQEGAVDNSQGIHQQRTIFQRYSRQTPHTNSIAQNNNITRTQSQRVVQKPKSNTPEMVQSNLEILSEQGSRQSPIEKVEKDDFLNESSNQIVQAGRGLNGVIESDSKIHYVQTQNMQNNFNQSHLSKQQQSMNPKSFINNWESTNQQHNLRHTITGGQNIPQRNNYQITANQLTLTRGTLPPNVNPSQYVSNQQMGNRQYMHNLNPNVPQHLPQSLMVQNSQFRPVDFIKQEQLRLQKSELVYTNRNPNFIGNQIVETGQHNRINHQPIINGSQSNRVQSLQNGRGNTRSLQRRATNITFNHNLESAQVNHQYTVPSQQLSNINQPNTQATVQRPASLTSKPVYQVPVNQPILNQPILNLPTLNHEPVIHTGMNQGPINQPQQVLTNPTHLKKVGPVQTSSSVPKSQNQHNWRQKYFALYSKFSQVNSKVEFITQEFYIYQKLIQTISVREEKTIIRHQNIQRSIQQLQQQCNSIIHEWRPTSIQGKNTPILINQQKDQSHLQIKYKRILFNFSKLQEESQKIQQENALIKSTFEQKINQVVKKLEAQNASLKSKLQKSSDQIIKKLQSQNAALKYKIQKISNQVVPKLQSENDNMKSRLSTISNEVLSPLKLLKKKTSFEYLRFSHHRATEEDQSQQSLQGWVQNVGQIIQAVQQHNFELQIKYNQMEHIIQGKDDQIAKLNEQLRHQNSNKEVNKPQKLAQSDDLALSISQRFQLEGSVAKYKQQSVFLQGQIQRLQQHNKKLLTSLKQNNKQINHDPFIGFSSLKQKQNQLKTVHKQQKSEIQGIEQIIFELNSKLEIYQHNFAQIQAENVQLTRINQNLEQELDSQIQKSKEKVITHAIGAKTDFTQYITEIELKSRQISQIEIQKVSIQQKNTVLISQIQRLNAKIASLQVSLRQAQSQQTNPSTIQQSPLIIQQYQFTVASLRSEVNRKQTELERQSKLNDQRNQDLTEQLKISYKQRENTQKRFDEKTLYFQGDRDKKQTFIRELRDKVYELQQKRRLQDVQDNRRSGYVNKMTSLTDNQQTNKLRSEIQSLKTQKESISKEYKIEVKKLEEQVQQFKQDTIRLKKQISQFANDANQIQNLNQALSKKNMEILELRSHLFENQKLNIENLNFRRQIQRQSEESIRIAQELQKINKSYIQVARSSRELEQNLSLSNNKFNSLQGEYNLILQANDRKDHQIVKLRQNNQLLQTNVDEVQRQNQKLKVKVRNLEVTFQHETSLLKQQNEKLKARLSDYEKLIREKSVSDHRITQLQAIVQKYEYQLKQKDELITKQKSKLKTVQSQNQDLTQQIDSFNEKVKQQEKKGAQSVKKYKKTVQQLQQKNKSLQQKQIKFEKEKITELEHDLKSKDNKIWKLQKQVEELLQRMDQIGDQQMDGQKILILQQKVKQYESRLFNQTFKYSPANYDYQATKVFERKVIYELKQENQRLRDYISQKKAIKPTNDKNQSASKAQIKIKQAYDAELDDVQGRLYAFNTKLQSLINNGSYDNVQAAMKKNQKSASKTAQLINGESASSVNNMFGSQNNDSNNQLFQMKLKYSQLERYCKNIQVQLLSGKSGTNLKSFTSTQTIINTSTHQNIINDQITFHKQKNRELQERVDKLLKMNTQLKQNLEDLLKQRNQTSSVSYYKEQIIELNEKINIFEIRIKKMIDQIDKLNMLLGKHSKGQESSQDKLFEYERKFIESQRTISQLNFSRSSLDKQSQSLRQLLQSKQYEIKALRNQLSLNGDKQSTAISSYRQKLQSQEIQMSKLINRLRINESQIERLNQVIKKKQAQTIQEVNRWRSKVAQLQEEINRASSQNQNEKSGQSNLKIEISKLTQELRALQFQNQEAKSINQNLLKKLQESDFKFKDLQSQFYDLQNDLMGKRVDESQWNMKFEQYEAQNVKFRNQIEFLKAEIQRLTQESKNKQRNYQIQIQSLQGKVGLAQREQFNLKRSTSSWESQKQSYEGQIARMKSQLAMFGSQIERRESEMHNKQRLYEQKISMLKTQITQIEGNAISWQQNSSSWAISKERYESQIFELRNEVSISKSQIQRLQAIFKQKESLFTSLQSSNSLWNDQKAGYEQQIAKLCNQTEILKSEIERIRFSLVQKESGIISLKSQNERLTLRLSQLENALSSTTNLQSSETEGLRKINEKLRAELQSLRQNYQMQTQNYKRKLSFVAHNAASLAYLIELSRSIYLQVEALVDQKQLSSQAQISAINSRIAEQLQKGLTTIVQINQVLADLY